MLVGGVQGRVHSKVYADTVAHELLTVKRLSYLDCRFDIEEGYDDAAERLERRPCVNFGMLIYCFADLGKGCELEDLGCEEVL